MKPSAAYLMAGSKRSPNGSFPNFFGELHPCAHRARHGDRVPAALRHRRHAFEAFERPPGRRAAGGVQAVQLLAVPQDAERVAADAVARRLDDGQRDGGCERRIDGIAAFQQHPEPRLRGERLRCGDHVARKHRHALRRIRKLPVEDFHGEEAGRESDDYSARVRLHSAHVTAARCWRRGRLSSTSRSPSGSKRHARRDCCRSVPRRR